MISISAAARSLPFSIAIRSLQREMIRRDRHLAKQATTESTAPPATGMRLGPEARHDLLPLRQRMGPTASGANVRLDEAPRDHPFGLDFEVESYLEAHANKFIGTFDANCYLYLSRAMDLFDVADQGGNLGEGLGRIGLQRALVIGVETDFLFPNRATGRTRSRAKGSTCKNIEFKRLASIQGHDSFLGRHGSPFAPQ